MTDEQDVMARAMRIPGAHAVAVLPLRDATAAADLLAAVTALVGPAGTADWDDLVFTGGPWFHVIRVLPDGGEPRVLHLTVDRRTGNLALARRELRALAARTPPGRAVPELPVLPALPARSGRHASRARPAPAGPRRAGWLDEFLNGPFHDDTGTVERVLAGLYRLA